MSKFERRIGRLLRRAARAEADPDRGSSVEITEIIVRTRAEAEQLSALGYPEREDPVDLPQDVRRVVRGRRVEAADFLRELEQGER